MITSARINEILNEEITKSEVESIASREVSSSYNSKEFERAVKKVTADAIENLFRTLWNRSSSWKGGISR